MDHAPTLPALITRPGQLAHLDALAASPEEEVWLASQKSARTRRAYRLDVAHFMRTLGITTPDQLRQVDQRAVIVWERIMREEQAAAASTVRRRLAALSSLFKHLVRHGAAIRNPVVDVVRPSINREEGTTAAFSKAQARKLLDAPAPDTLAGLRDRAILSVGLQVRLRRSEIAGLMVGDLHQNRGYDALRLTRKGGRRDALAINPQAAARIRAYLEKAGHVEDREVPMFRPLRGNAKAHDPAGQLDPDAIDRLVRKHVAAIGLARGHSAHSMRATFIITALETGAQLEDVQKAAGHRDPSTTKLYDRRHYNSDAPPTRALAASVYGGTGFAVRSAVNGDGFCFLPLPWRAFLARQQSSRSTIRQGGALRVLAGRPRRHRIGWCDFSAGLFPHNRTGR